MYLMFMGVWTNEMEMIWVLFHILEQQQLNTDDLD